MVPNPALDLFGETLMRAVRDESISHWTMIIDGRMTGDRAGQLRAKFEGFSEEQIRVLLSVVPDVVDTVLHQLLWCLEDSDDVQVAVTTVGGHVPNLKEVSDGLPGELYTENGWISRFSNRPDAM